MRPQLLLILAAALYAANPVLDRVDNKLNLIDSGHARRGSVIVFTPAEMNAWARGRVPPMYPGHPSDPSNVTLKRASGSGFAMIDLLKDAPSPDT